MAVPGVSKVVTVDIKGNWQRWLKVRDLTKGMTYLFRVQARTIAYGPELQANITAGPAEGEGNYKSKSQVTNHFYKHGAPAGNAALRASREFPSQGEAESRDVIQCVSQLP